MKAILFFSDDEKLRCLGIARSLARTLEPSTVASMAAATTIEPTWTACSRKRCFVVGGKRERKREREKERKKEERKGL